MTDEQYNHVIEFIEHTFEQVISNMNAKFGELIQEIRESNRRQTS
ncbi:MAG: hypothetical protein WCC10_11740 [Tumebacillaceae bacterium]